MRNPALELEPRKLSGTRRVGGLLPALLAVECGATEVATDDEAEPVCELGALRRIGWDTAEAVFAG